MPDQRDAERLLDQTRREIAAWRQEHARGRMPNRFWVQAADAAAQLGLDQVASRCELDPQRLRGWMQELELDLPATATSISRARPTALVLNRLDRSGNVMNWYVNLQRIAGHQEMTTRF